MEFIIGLATGIAVGFAIYSRYRPTSIVFDSSKSIVTCGPEHKMQVQGFMLQQIVELRKAAGLDTSRMHARLTEQGFIVFDDGGR